MRKGLLAASLLAAIGWVPVEATACGDKFLVIGRGVRRVPRTSHPASILLQLRPGSALPAAAREMKLEAVLKSAGHRVQTVTDAASLARWLQTRRYDVVLTDLEAAPDAARAVAASAPAPAVVPVAVRPSEAALAAAQKEFGFVIEAPTKSLLYLSRIDALMRNRVEKVASAARS